MAKAVELHPWKPHLLSSSAQILSSEDEAPRWIVCLRSSEGVMFSEPSPWGGGVWGVRLPPVQGLKTKSSKPLIKSPPSFFGSVGEGEDAPSPRSSRRGGVMLLGVPTERTGGMENSKRTGGGGLRKKTQGKKYWTDCTTAPQTRPTEA